MAFRICLDHLTGDGHVCHGHGHAITDSLPVFSCVFLFPFVSQWSYVMALFSFLSLHILDSSFRLLSSRLCPADL